MENVNDAAKMIAQAIEKLKLKTIQLEMILETPEKALRESIEMLESALEKLVVKM